MSVAERIPDALKELHDELSAETCTPDTVGDLVKQIADDHDVPEATLRLRYEKGYFMTPEEHVEKQMSRVKVDRLQEKIDEVAARYRIPDLAKKYIGRRFHIDGDYYRFICHTYDRKHKVVAVKEGVLKEWLLWGDAYTSSIMRQIDDKEEVNG